MRTLKIFLFAFFYSLHIYSQDTIVYMDGSIKIVESFSNSIMEPILNKVSYLQFIDNESHIIEIDTINDRKQNKANSRINFNRRPIGI